MQRAAMLSLLLLGGLFTGCIGAEDSSDLEQQSQLGENAASWAREIPSTITGLEHVTASVLMEEGLSGAGTWNHGDYTYVAGLSTGFHVVDVSDPEAPEVVGSISGEQVYSRDVDLVHYEQQTVAVLATQSGGMTFVDVTDPTDPQILSILEIEPNHNVAVVPGTHIVYNSPSTGEGRANEIVDVTDPLKPEIVGEFGEFGCHDTSFFISEDGQKQRAYCAGVDTSQIWDISDPTEPVLVTAISNPCMDDASGPATRSNCGGLHHSAFTNEDGTVLILGDEFQGGGGPGCGAHEDLPVGSVSTPVGALWFYDISDETAPELLGWFAPDVPAMNHAEAVLATAQGNPTGAPFSASCTSHFGEIVPGKEMAVMAWYHAGVLLIDFSDPANPVQVDQWNPGTQTWDARIHNGYIFTGDIARGLDVLTFAGE